MKAHFPFGYAVLVGFISVILGILYWGLAPAEGSGTVEPIDEAVVIEEGGHYAGVDPRFVADDRVLSPDERLIEAAGREIKRPADYEEFVNAMTDHPFVETVYMARYGHRFPYAEGYRNDRGFAAFRRHYRRAVEEAVSPDMLPVFGCALQLDQQHTMEHLLVNDADWRAQVDKDVEAAIKGD
jgi:hypothetical protein